LFSLSDLLDHLGIGLDSATRPEHITKQNAGADADKVKLDFEIHQSLWVSVFALKRFDFGGFENIPLR
jgi:uncharacterized protein YbaA (DUF1428 family)